MLAAADVNSVAHLLNIYWNNLTLLFFTVFILVFFSFFLLFQFSSFIKYFCQIIKRTIYIIPSNQTFQEQNWTIFNCSSVKPLITNTSKEFIKCRILHFLIMECCRYLVFLIKWLYGTLKNCSRIFMTIYLFSQIQKFTKYSIKLIEKLSRRHLINSSDVFVIK